MEEGPPGQLSVTLLTGTLPRLSTMEVARRSLETDEQRALFDRAGRMSAGLAARRETLLRIGAYIAATQSAFFLGHHETLVPVTRADAAAALAMHASTLGRALAGKALLADNKVYPLSLFFSHALPGADGGRFAVRHPAPHSQPDRRGIRRSAARRRQDMRGTSEGGR